MNNQHPSVDMLLSIYADLEMHVMHKIGRRARNQFLVKAIFYFFYDFYIM